jgi:hypothetical protein
MPTFRNTLFHLHGWAGRYEEFLHAYPPACEDGTECSETSAYKIQMPGNYPEESIQHSEHGKSLESRIIYTSLMEKQFVVTQTIHQSRFPHH